MKYIFFGLLLSLQASAQILNQDLSNHPMPASQMQTGHCLEAMREFEFGGGNPGFLIPFQVENPRGIYAWDGRNIYRLPTRTQMPRGLNPILSNYTGEKTLLWSYEQMKKDNDGRTDEAKKLINHGFERIQDWLVASTFHAMRANKPRYGGVKNADRIYETCINVDAPSFMRRSGTRTPTVGELATAARRELRENYPQIFATGGATPAAAPAKP